MLLVLNFCQVPKYDTHVAHRTPTRCYYKCTLVSCQTGVARFFVA
jgi:hypothetical protein